MTDARNDGELVVASHEALFATESEARCDACGAPLPPPAEDEGDDFRVRGHGVYLWTRGDELRFEKAPLCAECASAIGMTALARWEIEEEEG
jgi:hypothetical protein